MTGRIRLQGMAQNVKPERINVGKSYYSLPIVQVFTKGFPLLQTYLMADQTTLLSSTFVRKQKSACLVDLLFSLISKHIKNRMVGLAIDTVKMETF